VAPPGELQVNAGVLWLAGNTVWSTPERIRGEVLTTMRYTNRRLHLCLQLMYRRAVPNSRNHGGRELWHFKSNIFDNTCRSKKNKQTINEKQPAICMKTQYDNNVLTWTSRQGTCSDRCPPDCTTDLQWEHQSSKKFKDFNFKLVTVADETIVSGREFQTLITPFEKKWPSRTEAVWVLYSFTQFPGIW